MAKFSYNSKELKDDERVIFGTDDDAFIEWDEVGNQLEVSTVVSGVDPTEDWHLTTRYYVDNMTSSYPRYYITADLNIQVSDWGQYVIHETGSLEVAGTLEFGEGGMLIIQGVE